MIAFLLSFAESIGIPAPFRKAAVIVSAVLLLIALLAVGKCAYDRHVIANHDAKQNAQVANEVIQADRYAGQNKTARDNDFANSQGAIGNAVGNAVATNPTKVKQPVGPASQAYYDELRRQQQEKQHGRKR